ncbi:ABC transporter permease [Ilumatobacter sp.]|uniref:ABC transporter permease n=1 Tax=Ilumatobacter sp. TaxID=1967498 RepID=UPI003B52D955
MIRYTLRRVLGMVPILIGTTLIIFLTVWALPGDPLQSLAGPTTPLSPSVRAVLIERYNLDEPLLTQYWLYVTDLVTGDLGTDLEGKEVSEKVGRAWPVTLKLGLSAWLVAGVIGITLGSFAGIRPGGKIDLFVLSLTTLILGIPFFVIAFVLQYLVGVELGWLPTSGVREGWPINYIMPAFVLGMFAVPEVARLTRAAVIDNRTADYVDTAKARGIPHRRIVVRHILRNSLVPIVSLMGLVLGNLLGGAVLIEAIFNIPGIGFEVFRAIRVQNGPVVIGVSTMLVLVYLVVNLVVDLLYGLLDPRISLERKGA